MIRYNYSAKNVKCPFYCYDDKQKHRIACEGLIEQSKIHYHLFKINDMDKHITDYCSNAYKDCPIAKMLYDKYK